MSPLLLAGIKLHNQVLLHQTIFWEFGDIDKKLLDSRRMGMSPVSRTTKPHLTQRGLRWG